MTMVNIGGQWVNVDPSYQTVGPEAYDQMVPDTQTQGSGRDQLLAILADALTGATDSTEARRQLSAWLKGVGETNTDAVADAWLRQLTEGEYSGVSPAEAISSLLGTLQSDPRWVPILGPATGGGGAGGGAGGGGGGQTGGGSTTWPEPVPLPGATDEDLLSEEQQYQKWLLGSTTYQSASPLLRRQAMAMGNKPQNGMSELGSRYNEYLAANPEAWTFEGDKPIAAQGWLDFIKGGGQRLGTQQGLAGIRNVLGAIEQPLSAAEGNPYTAWAQGRYGDEGDQDLMDLILGVSGRRLPSMVRQDFMRGAQRRYGQQQLLNPNLKVQDWAKSWGLL